MLYLEEPFYVAIYRLGAQTDAGLIKCECYDAALDRFIPHVVEWKEVHGDDPEERKRAAVAPLRYLPSYGDLRRWAKIHPAGGGGGGSLVRASAFAQG